MKQKIINVIILLLFTAGMASVLYPGLLSYQSDKRARSLIKVFEQEAEVLQEAASDSTEITSQKSEELYAAMEAYNQKIYDNGQANLQDPFFYETPAFNLEAYGFENNVAGYIKVPAMNMELPIYLGATKDTLALGAGNLGYTSVPTGGINTNTVLAGHRGWQGTPMFRDIESMQIGDKVYITNFWRTLVYQVVEIKIILPADVQEIGIREGRDMLTLLTCHPYTKNVQRYVVYCERITDEEAGGQEGTSDTSDAQIRRSVLFRWSELSESQQMILVEKWVPVLIVELLTLLLIVKIVIKVLRKLIAAAKG